MSKFTKKLISGLLAVASIFTLTAQLTFASEQKNDILYSQTFAQSSSVNDFTNCTTNAYAANPYLEYNADKEAAEFTGEALRGALLLPDNINVDNFVMETDMSYKKTTAWNDSSISFGFVSNHKDGKNSTYVTYFPLNGTVMKGEAKPDDTDSSGVKVSTRYSEKGKGSQLLLPEDTMVHLKLIVNKGLMEFFVDGELVYTYYSPDGTRINDTYFSRNYQEKGRVGIFTQASNVKFTIDGIRVRNVKASDVSYYSNTFIDPKKEMNFSSMSSLISSSKISSNTFRNENWGTAAWSANGWSKVGNYIPVSVTGDYTVDVDFTLNNPFNDSRYIAIAFGINKGSTSNVDYSLAAVAANGNMSIEQKSLTSDADNNKGGANTIYGSCKSTITDDKKCKEYSETYQKPESGDSKNYLLAYVPSNFTYTTEADLISRRHTMHLEVKSGIAKLTFEGTTVECVINKNATDGYIGICSAATAATIYSVRVAPYSVDEPIEEPTTRLKFGNSDIGATSATAQVLVKDDLNAVDENSRVLLAAYDDSNKLIGIDTKEITDGIANCSISYAEVADVKQITLRAFLWSMKTLEPLCGAIDAKQEYQLFEKNIYSDTSKYGEATLPYRLHIPEDYDPQEKYPVILFLHCAGERGDDNEKNLANNNTLPQLARGSEYPCIIVVPQCPAGQQWVNTPWKDGNYNQDNIEISTPLSMVKSLLDNIEREYSIDTNREYIMGVSMGGFGTWDMITRYPERFAAAIPICGGADPNKATLIKDMPIWTFHGTADEDVPYAGTQAMVKALTDAGAENVKFITYEGANHAATWVKAYQEPDFYSWLFAQTKNK